MSCIRIIMPMVAAGLTTAAMAAGQGSLGSTSSGQSDISVTKGDMVAITDIADLDLGSFNSAASTLSASDNICVFSSTGSYQITVTSANGSFALAESGGGVDTIAYQLTWADDSGTPAPVTYGSSIASLIGNSSSTSCGGSTNAGLAIEVPSANFNSAAPGAYTDTLTLTIVPE